MRKLLTVDLSGAAGTDTTRFIGVGRTAVLLGVLLCGEAITGHATNIVDFNVFAADGSTLLWNRDTLTAGDGALVSGTLYGVSPDGTLSAPVPFESGIGGAMGLTLDQTFKVSAVHSGSGQAVSAVLTLIIDDGRDYS